MAKPHKFAWNGLDVETGLTIEQLANMAQRAAMDSTGDLMHGKQRIASTRSGDRQIEFRINDYLISFKKLLDFVLDFEERSGRIWMTSRITWYLTYQSTVGGFIPVSTKTMVAHHTYLQFVRNLAAQVAAGDPGARVRIREGVEPASPASGAAGPSTPALAAASGEPPPAQAGPPIAFVERPAVPNHALPPPPPPLAQAGPPIASAERAAVPNHALPPPPPPPAVYARPVSPPPPPPVQAARAILPAGLSAAEVPAGGMVTAVPGIITRAPEPPAEPQPVSHRFADLAAQMFAEDEDLDATRVAQAGGAALPWVFALPDGQAIRFESTVVAGRNPSAPNGVTATAVALDDPNRSVSKTHALIELRGGLPWVTDLHSTNGTTLTNGIGEAVRCEPGVAMPVGDGWRIDFGAYEIAVARER